MLMNTPENLYIQIRDLLLRAKQHSVYQINTLMVRTYFEIGRFIVEHEQQGKARAAYGKQTLDDLAQKLSAEFGKGFSVVNLRKMRQFFLTYAIQQTASVELQTPDFQLSWSHYLKLMRMEDAAERNFYEIESAANNWSLKELQRQFDSALYQRLALSTDKKGVYELAQKGQIINAPQDAIKDPYILEFLNLPEKSNYSESELENEIIDKLADFLLELGKGFTFVGRQKRISFDERHFRIDLVFFNRILRCFVLIDLKIGDLKHQDLGQMQMYVNYYDRAVKLPDENKTVGIVLCRDKSETLVEYTLPEDNEQIFASRYLTILPDKKILEAQLKDIHL
jgi:predicted nuclease of restriction endonuclease-like (RecB) superfamily